MYYQCIDCRVLGRQPTKVIIGVTIGVGLACRYYKTYKKQ
jgi:hypothetical protein